MNHQIIIINPPKSRMNKHINNVQKLGEKRKHIKPEEEEEEKRNRYST